MPVLNLITTISNVVVIRVLAASDLKQHGLSLNVQGR
jgi:hypothetical protein